MTVEHSPGQEQEEILWATLSHVPFEGWTMEALRKGCESLGYPKERANWLFGATPMGLLEAFFLMMDRKMLLALDQHDLSQMRVRDRVALGIKLRLDLLEPHKIAVDRALVFLSHPTRLREGLSFVARTVSEIWYAAGDNATDFNYYTKRALLMGVYMTTLRFWLRDTSPQHKATHDFLETRLDQAMQIPKVKEKLKQVSGKLSSLFR